MIPTDQRFRELAIAWNDERARRDKAEANIRTWEIQRNASAAEMARLEKDLATFVGTNIPRKIAVVDERSGVMVALSPPPALHPPALHPFVMRIDLVMPEKG